MIPVSQTKFFTEGADRGSCMQACVASVFEIPEARAPEQSEISQWTRFNYPGLAYVARETVGPQEEPPVPASSTAAYWIATVHTQTEGFVDECFRCWEYEGNANGPPLHGEPHPCPWCGERWGLEHGTRPGYHGIVMLGREIVHDPGRAPDWDAARVYCGAAWWLVVDPARVPPRAAPEPPVLRG